jgi:asparagine synthase (glutamine-hydrolysing)
MRGFVVLAGEMTSGLGRALVQGAKRTRGASAWHVACLDPTLAVFVRGPCPPPVHLAETGDGLLIGEVFAGPGRSLNAARPISWTGLGPDQVFRRLTDEVWGRYVALVRRGDQWSAFRDPSGGLECFTWRRDGLTVFASEMAPWLSASLPDDAGLDDDRLALLIAAPIAHYGASAVRGVTALAPGQSLVGAGLRAVWSPGSIARQRDRSEGGNQRRLVETVSATVAALVGLDGMLGAEISGGLDSSIVAAAMPQAARSGVASWLNFYIDEPLGDERRYARAVAERLGLPLTIAEKPEGSFDLHRQRSLGLTFRPPTSGVDQPYDRLIAQHAMTARLDRLISGQGGDTVFLHAPAPGIARDLVLDRGLRGLFSPAAIDLARWMRRSVWSIAREAVGRGPIAEPLGVRPMAFAADQVRALVPTSSLHPWLDDLDGVSPAKRFQIHSLALSQRLNTASERARQVDCLHPLLAQPVMEFSLRTSAIDLTRGGRDRALARQAFSAALPSAVLQRRSKGDGTAFFSRMVEASLPALRPLLLEGELSRRGLLDRDRLEAMLTPEHLVCEAGYPEFLDAAAIELWINGWSDWRSRRPAGPPAGQEA